MDTRDNTRDGQHGLTCCVQMDQCTLIHQATCRCPSRDIRCQQSHPFYVCMCVCGGEEEERSEYILHAITSGRMGIWFWVHLYRYV